MLSDFRTLHDNASIDWTTLEHEFHWLLERGASGLAMGSQALRLSLDELREMAEFVCRAVADRGAVVISPVGWRLDDDTRQEVNRSFELITEAAHGAASTVRAS